MAIEYRGQNLRSLHRPTWRCSVHVFEVMENCTTYEPWHDKATHRTYFRIDGGKCAHYYVYFIDKVLGLCHLRIPTWAPFRLQFCLNGHNWLANEMTKAGIEFTQVDNAFISIADVEAAQFIANGLSPKTLHRRLDDAVRRFAPALRDFESGIHWSLMQVEYATDLVFSSTETLKPKYEEIVRTLVHAVQPDQVAMFLGKRLDPRFEGELGSSLVRRTHGLCLRHFMSSSGIKIYDKFGRILRIECFTNNVGFFKHHRRVEHRNGTYSYQTAPVRKTIYSLGALAKIMAACNRRYLEFLGAVDDPTNGIRAVEKISARVREGDRTWRGFNMFDADDLAVVRAVAQAHMLGFGFRNRHVRQHLPHRSSSQIARAIKRLRKHGIVKKVAGAFRYYLTTFGKTVVAAALKLKEMFLVPSLRGHLANS